MWKFIVTWVLLTTVQIPCPDANKTDEFGRTSNLSCAVYHCKIVSTNKSKEFTDREKAFEFYKRASEGNKTMWFNSDIVNVKIDSVFIAEND